MIYFFSDKEFSDIRFFPERQVKSQEDACNQKGWRILIPQPYIGLISNLLLLPIYLPCPLQPLVLLQEPHMEQYLDTVRIALDVGTLLLGR